MKLSELNSGDKFKFKPNQKVFELPTGKTGGGCVEYETNYFLHNIFEVTAAFKTSLDCKAGIVNYRFKFKGTLQNYKGEPHDCEIELIK